jgi:hypothetical protein
MIFYYSMGSTDFFKLKIRIMRRNGLGLLLAGLAAYGYYKYSKMNDQQKRDLKEKGKKFLDKNIPDSMRNVFSKKATNGTQNIYSQP